ncbi:RCC1 domain-containing protein [Xanthomonas arboricola]|uniref:RCC1 domain-containing protein n=1 Tax=Xanthomonas arboricola TaxID=56448 RepID=UPI000E1F8DC3|nr:hypothetical protein [Xanthomonas arboricola]
MSQNTKPYWVIIALVVATPIVLGVIVDKQRARKAEDARTAMRSILECPSTRPEAWQIPGLERIDSIAFQQDRLTAIDDKGLLWWYYAFPTTDCIGKPERIYPGRLAGDEDPAATRVGRITSSLAWGVGLTTDGRLFRWGTVGVNLACEPGAPPGTCTKKSTDFRTDIVDASSSDEHLLAVNSTGDVWSDGLNDCGQLGRPDPLGGVLATGYGRVPDLTNVVAVATGARYSLALDKSGAVWGWGNLSNSGTLAGGIFHAGFGAILCRPNGEGPLGVDEAPHATPEKISGLPAIKSISLLNGFALALSRDGHVWAWGSNECGAIGLEPPAGATSVFQAKPHRIEGMPHIVAISAGVRHAIFLDKNGGVWATGNNGARQLGLIAPPHAGISLCQSSRDSAGTESYSSIPLKVPGLPPAIAIAAGRDRSAAVDRDGHVWIWGRVP